MARDRDLGVEAVTGDVTAATGSGGEVQLYFAAGVEGRSEGVCSTSQPRRVSVCMLACLCWTRMVDGTGYCTPPQTRDCRVLARAAYDGYAGKPDPDACQPGEPFN